MEGRMSEIIGFYFINQHIKSNREFFSFFEHSNGTGLKF